MRSREAVALEMSCYIRSLSYDLIYACTLNVRPLAVLRSFSSDSGRALRRTRYVSEQAQQEYTCGRHTLEEVGSPLAHPRVDKSLGSLDVVVEVVAEGLDV